MTDQTWMIASSLTEVATYLNEGEPALVLIDGEPSVLWAKGGDMVKQFLGDVHPAPLLLGTVCYYQRIQPPIGETIDRASWGWNTSES